jgi:peroxiredoxin
VQLARTIGDPALVKRWARRLLEADPTFRLSVASWLVQMPSLRTDALPLLDREIERAGEEDRPVDPAEVEEGAFPASPRDVTESRLLYEERQRQALGRLFGLQGQAYLAIGDTLSALRALDSAWHSGWDPEQFRVLGSLRLARGDSAGATAALARVAVDPVTRAEAESLAAMVGADPAIWAAAVERARADMLIYVRQQEIDRAPLLPRLRLLRIGGSEETLPLARGTPMLVAFWSRYCAPSNAQMPALANVAAQLEAAGIPVVTIADEDAAPLAAYTEEQALAYPVYADPDHDARRAFDAPGFPTFYVLDGEGRIRFETHSAAESLRFLDSLRPTG